MSAELIVSVASAIWGFIKDLLSYFSRKSPKEVYHEPQLIQKRFEVYQEAYGVAEKLKFLIHDDDKKTQAIIEARDWYAQNCLYLEPDLREKFRIFVHKVGIHRDLIEHWRFVGQSDDFEKEEAKTLAREIEENYRQICNMQEDIQKAIDKYYQNT